MRRIYKILLLALLLTSCDKYDLGGLFKGTSPETDKRFADSMEWNNAHGYARLTVDDSYRVYVGSDSHITEGMDKNLKAFVNAYKSDAKCPFAIHLGDMIDGKGGQALFEKDINLRPEGYIEGKDTIFTVTGNHDLYFDQWGEFLKYRHTSTFYVETVSHSGELLDLYIFIDSGSGTLGRKQTAWLQELLEERSGMGYRHIIVSTHTHFFQRDMSQEATSNYNMEETTTLLSLFSKYNVTLVLAGHDHSFEDTMFGGVRYLTADAMKTGGSDPSYILLEVDGEIGYSKVKF